MASRCDFSEKRIYRLFPAGIATVPLLVWLHGERGIYVAYEGDFSPLIVLLNMLMVRTDINAVMWSLKVECLATPDPALRVAVAAERGWLALGDDGPAVRAVLCRAVSRRAWRCHQPRTPLCLRCRRAGISLWKPSRRHAACLRDCCRRSIRRDVLLLRNAESKRHRVGGR